MVYYCYTNIMIFLCRLSKIDHFPKRTNPWTIRLMQNEVGIWPSQDVIYSLVLACSYHGFCGIIFQSLSWLVYPHPPNMWIYGFLTMVKAWNDPALYFFRYNPAKNQGNSEKNSPKNQLKNVWFSKHDLSTFPLQLGGSSHLLSVASCSPLEICRQDWMKGHNQSTLSSESKLEVLAKL